MGATIDINSDMGESFGVYTMGDDEAMLDVVSTANVACGFHAGDPLVMHRTVSLARARGVAVGAHPSFLDLWGFGRRPIQGERPEDIEKMIIYQIGAIQAVARAAGHRVTHVKAHGSLGNMAAVDADLAMAVARAVKAVDPSLYMIVMPGLETERAAEALGLPMAREIYADRTYDDNGNLTPRKKPGAVIHDAEVAGARVLEAIERQSITTVSGKRIPTKIESVCVHGDNPAGVAIARAVRRRLEGAGLTVRPFARA